MTISIVTPTFNSAATVADTLQSVATQTYKDIEHIIIDGLSRDNTIEIVRQYPHVQKVFSEKDKGIFDGMNKGVSQATGEVVGILNSDDLYNNTQVIEWVMDRFADPSVDVVYGDLLYVDAKDLNKVVRYWKAGNYSASSFYRGWMPPHPTFFVRRRFYEQFGDFHLKLRSAADYELMLRFLLRHRLRPSYIPKVLVRMRMGGNSNASFKGRLKANAEDREAWAMNSLKPHPWTLWLKPLRKLPQFVKGIRSV
jgi:glycosyltransferase